MKCDRQVPDHSTTQVGSPDYDGTNGRREFKKRCGRSAASPPTTAPAVDFLLAANTKPAKAVDAYDGSVAAALSFGIKPLPPSR